MLNVQFVTLLLSLLLMEMNAEEYALEEHIGRHQIILAKCVFLLVLAVLRVELMTVAVVL